MAQLLAPYNNSMRLGQGFNSYTQQTCLDQAVLPDPTLSQSDALRRKAAGDIEVRPTKHDSSPSPEVDTDGSVSGSKLLEGMDSDSEPGTDAGIIEAARREALSGSKSPESGLTVPPWVKPQIVTYSSRFVDKLSDVTDAMNISGSLSIKTATIGGKANGSYVDSDKFKTSDINFHLQVKVTNQVVEPGNYCIFNKIPHIPKERFNEIYGDTFISGWESGGELNAIISMKIADKSKVFEIKASLEAELTTPSFAGAVSGEFEKTKKNITSDTETTIAVNWSGGGRIKDPAEDWSIASLKKAAAAFPDLVAITPQRTYAILTKYTALESFHLQNRGFSPLDYENAGVYTGSLLDNYMDYKSLWKQISFACYELEGNRATIDMAQPAEEVYDLAKVKGPMPSVKKSAQKLLEGRTKGSLDLAKEDAVASSNETENEEIFSVFPASFAGLIQARKVCRMEMAKIVNEVDAVAEDPSIASDATRDSYFLNPLIFKQLVPVVRSLSAENSVLGVKDPNAAVILGYGPPLLEAHTVLPLYKFNVSIEKQDHRLQASVKRWASKAEDYRMHGTAGEVEQVHENATMFNALDRLNPTFRPKTISVWAKDNTVQGIQITYSKGEIMTFGVIDENSKATPTQTLELDSQGSETIVEINIKTGITGGGDKYIAAISMATSACQILNTFTGTEKDAANLKLQTVRYVRYDDQPWSLRGFFGFANEGRLISLGVVWGKDSFVPVPNLPLAQPLCRNLLGMSPVMQKDVLGHMARLHNRSKFLMGDFAGASSEKAEIFNALTKVESTWTIAKLGFATANTEDGKSKLSGLKVFYTNGKSITHGAYPEKDEQAAWICDVNSPIVTAKLVTSGDSKEETKNTFIESVEFILAADNLGQLPGWPLDVGTVRFLSGEEEQSQTELPALVEAAPKPGRTIWSMKGFYGEYADGFITQLGIVWGRS